VTTPDPYPEYHRLRAEDPVHHEPATASWVLTRYADMEGVLRAPGWSCDHRNAIDHQRWLADMGAPEAIDSLMSKVLLFMDPPEHTRLRSLVSKAFTPKAVEGLRPRVERILDDLLAPLRANGEMDVIADVGYPFPVTVICELLGVPVEDRDLFRTHTRQLAIILEWQLTNEQFMGAAEASFAFATYLFPLFEERRRDPRDDLISALVTAEVDGDRLGPDELLTTCVLLLTAGHETTMNLVGNGLLALLRQPDQLRSLRDVPTFGRNAVDELLRFDSPVQLTARTALSDMEVGGQCVRQGEQVIALLGAANRDPAVFADPDRLDLARANANRHLAFGAGHHFCLGAALARLEAEVALTALVRLPGLELAADDVEWRESQTLRGLQALPISFWEQ